MKPAKHKQWSRDVIGGGKSRAGPSSTGETFGSGWLNWVAREPLNKIRTVNCQVKLKMQNVFTMSIAESSEPSLSFVYRQEQTTLEFSFEGRDWAELKVQKSGSI